LPISNFFGFFTVFALLEVFRPVIISFLFLFQDCFYLSLEVFQRGDYFSKLLTTFSIHSVFLFFRTSGFDICTMNYWMMTYFIALSKAAKVAVRLAALFVV
jgi:hypothetical protein